ncbi:alcohol dehydrogenase [Achromatium sp. WMS3]|nr:alcohol dehydrogenase [Achromatium sp. WMS3]
MNKWQETLIKPETSIVEALKVIDTAALQVALVVNEQQQLLGIVTDGDIRRGLLKHIDLNEPVKNIMNKKPTVIIANEPRQQRLAIMKHKKLFHLPIIDDQGKIIDLETIDDLIKTPVLNNWVVLMAGGLGTRLRPLTNECPKPLLKISEKPLLEIILENFIEYGFKNFFISVNYKSHMIKEHFGNGSKWGINIEYLEEQKALGTAGALSLLPKSPTEPLLIMNGDIMTRINFQHLLDFHVKHKAKATLCVRKYQHQIPYGVVKTEQQKLITIEEKPIKNYFINAGVYIINPEIIDDIPTKIKFDMPNLFKQLIEKRQTTAAFPVHEYWLDIGRMDDFERAHEDYREVFL